MQEQISPGRGSNINAGGLVLQPQYVGASMLQAQPQQMVVVGKDPTNEQKLPPNVTKISKRMNSGDINFIVDCMRKRFAFSNLNQEQLETCAETCLYGEIQEGTVLIEPGMKSRNFFIIEQGQVTITFESGEKNSLNGGEGFGEMSLIHNIDT